MLQAVGHPVAVNPDSRLARHARASGWPIVHFSQRTKSVIRRSVTAAGATAIAGASFAVGRQVRPPAARERPRRVAVGRCHQ